MTKRCFALSLLACVLSSSCGGTDRGAAAVDCSTITAGSLDACVRMNQIQTLGTHNSYHVVAEPAVLAVLGPRARNLEYTHRPLTEQLAQLGIRQFEIDVFADPEGGRHATPAAFRLARGATLEPVSEDMRIPGFKVLHVQDLDYRTRCATFMTCLTEIRDWSRANPTHVPVLVLVEVKDSPVDDPTGIGFVTPVAIGAPELHALDAEIRSVFDADHLLTPDDVRGRHATLNEAIVTDGWPRLGDVRGKVLFALDNTDAHRDAYLEGNRSLEGRVLFVTSPPGDPSAAFLKLNESMGDDEVNIRRQVQAGYLVRTRADVPTDEARSGNTTRRDAAFRSGAQYVSTDYPEESPFGSGYRAQLPEAETLAARCNPVNAPAGCRHAWLEPR